MPSNLGIHTLPPEIILTIVKLFIGKELSSIIHELKFKPERIKGLLIFSYLCRSWRTIILSLVYKTYAIDVRIFQPTRLYSKTPFLILNALAGTNSRYVRKLEIKVDYENIVNNKLFQTLESPLLSNTCFDSVVVVKVDVTFSSYGTQSDSNEPDTKAAPLRQAIVKLAPNLHRVQFSVDWDHLQCADDTNWLGISTAFIEDLCAYGSVKSISAEIFAKLIPNPSQGYIANITCISCLWKLDPNSMSSIIRLNAQSLQRIVIIKAKPDEVGMLIKTSDGRPVIYPYVTHLKIIADMIESYDIDNSRPVFNDHVPFPRLQDFYTDIIYPFSDNVLFRGNLNNIKSLSLDFDNNLLDIIARHVKTFGHAFSSVEKIEVITRISEADGNYDFLSQVATFLTTVRHSVRYIVMHDSEIIDYFVLRLSFQHPFQNMGALYLGEYKASLTNIFTILSAMPALQRISSGLFELPEIEEAIDNNGWMDRLYSRFGGAFHKNIQHWNLCFEVVVIEASETPEFVEVDQSVYFSVIYASVLAVICPNFKGIRMPPMYMDEYITGIAEKTKGPAFSKYSYIVKRLLRISNYSTLSKSSFL